MTTDEARWSRLAPEVAQFLREFEALGLPPLETMPVALAREGAIAQMQAVDQKPEPVARIDNRTLPGPAGPIPVRVYAPSEGPLPIFVYIHGGGWVICNLDTHDHVCRAIANRANCMVVSVDYRLAPEHRFPAAVDDCYAAVRGVHEQAAAWGGDPSRLAVGGDSAGGNPTASVCLKIRDEGGPAVALQVLVYPVTDISSLDRPSVREFADGYFLTRSQMEWFRDHYAPTEADRRHPLASPLLAPSLADLPPAFVITAECDVLRDEGEAYAERLRQAGVPAPVSRHPRTIHAFYSLDSRWPSAQRAWDETAAALRQAWAVS